MSKWIERGGSRRIKSAKTARKPAHTPIQKKPQDTLGPAGSTHSCVHTASCTHLYRHSSSCLNTRCRQHNGSSPCSSLRPAHALQETLTTLGPARRHVLQGAACWNCLAGARTGKGRGLVEPCQRLFERRLNEVLPGDHALGARKGTVLVGTKAVGAQSTGSIVRRCCSACSALADGGAPSTGRGAAPGKAGRCPGRSTAS